MSPAEKASAALAMICTSDCCSARISETKANLTALVSPSEIEHDQMHGPCSIIGSARSLTDNSISTALTCTCHDLLTGMTVRKGLAGACQFCAHFRTKKCGLHESLHHEFVHNLQLGCFMLNGKVHLDSDLYQNSEEMMLLLAHKTRVIVLPACAPGQILSSKVHLDSDHS